MIHNKITIGDTDFELEQTNSFMACAPFNTPVVHFGGNTYIGKAIPNKPDKDYVIKSVANGPHWRCHPEGFEYYLKNGYTINQVLRLSDNYIWTIGDQTQYGKINKFFLLQSHDENMSVECELGNCYLNDLTKPKRIPLFYADNWKTPIYDQQQYYWVGYPVNGITHKIAHRGITYNFLEEQKAFSTFEKANEYVLMNKADKSINDVLNLFDKGRSFVGIDFLKERLIELTKEKLNK